MTKFDQHQLDLDNQQARADIRSDSAIQNLLERMPKDVQDSFTESQLAHLRVALGARSWGNHKVDLRSTFKFFKYRYYYVFVAGRNRRELSRQEKQFALMVQALFVSGFIIFSALFGIFVLYIIKSALGIDIFPNFSFGVWSWFKETFLG
ncbi:hypothetical protein PULV_b0190 [Pseudoalteromonas ulvae UL12]|uniref:3-phosphoshikimate 1-carboxyvinyltransferase n=1 Tax=Pseudoalteromonas ulvae TaxID=107327 RepID=UPI00186B6BA2|nr:3-phosphoshikimate 1-carboxyvinyltransferase [Pseudoalteromonas ulvae]MBE0365585.1 hypothetical protein [Pseudoalteromonas ulvae UL12]